MAPRKPLRRAESRSVTAPKPIPAARLIAAQLEQEHSEDSDASASEVDEVQDQPEYHTDESEDDDEDADVDDEIGGGEDELEDTAAPPYLPAHLLGPLPAAPVLAPQPVSISWEHMTRGQKQGQRRTARQQRQRQLARLKRDAEANGVLAAGRAAQVKRGVLATRDVVKSGRIGKKRKASKVQASGRQVLLEQRKRVLVRGEGGRSRKRVKGKAKS